MFAILMYYHISPTIGPHSVTPESFRSQLQALINADFQFLHVDTLEDFASDRRQDNGRFALVTFDDGWLDNWVYAFPILREFGLPASLFLVTGWPGSGSARGAHQHELPADCTHWDTRRAVDQGETDRVVLRWSELKTMADSGVFRVHCHSHSHGENWRRYRDEQSAIVDDAERCRERLEEQLGYRSHHFCWPRGRFTPALFDRLQQRGFAFQHSTLMRCQ